MERPPKPNVTKQFFSYAHLPPHLQEISKIFADAAEKVLALPDSHERQKSLDALLIAKDAGVRASLAKPFEWDDLAKQWVQPGANGPAINPSSIGA